MLNCALVALLAAGVVGLSRLQALDTPANPLAGISPQRSHMMITAAPVMQISADVLLDGESPVNPAVREEDFGEAENQQAAGPTSQLAENTDGGQEDPSATVEDDVIYFTTNIRNGQTVSEPELAVEITHKIRDLKILEEKLVVNGSHQPQFAGGKKKVTLEEGKNTLKVQVQYQKADGTTVTPSKTYTVIYKPEDLIISAPRLEQLGDEVQLPTLSFAASATWRGGEPLPVKVDLNGEFIAEDNSFSLTLVEGKNTIRLYAEHQGKEAEKTYTTSYVNPTLWVDTDLEALTQNGTVMLKAQSPDFSFTAVARGGRSPRLSVDAQGVPYQKNGDVFSLTLSNTPVTVTLQAKEAGFAASAPQVYTLVYVPPVGKNPGPNNGLYPWIEFTDCPAEVNKLTYRLKLRAYDTDGTPLGHSSVKLYLNNAEVPCFRDDGGEINYDLNLVEGANQIAATVYGSRGSQSDCDGITMMCSPVNEGEVRGSVTISVEAGTIGKQPVGRQSVELIAGESAPALLERVLAANGLSAVNGGGGEYYLAAVTGGGIADGWEIPGDLQDKLNADGQEFNDTWDSNSLAEHHFYPNSGWMVTLNGHFISHSIALLDLNDGDELRFRYTLNMGKDLGGDYGSW